MAVPCNHGLMRACQQCDPVGFLNWMNGLAAPATFPLPEPMKFSEQFLRDAVDAIRQRDLQPRDERWIVSPAEYQHLVKEYGAGHCVMHATTFEPGGQCPTCVALARPSSED